MCPEVCKECPEVCKECPEVCKEGVKEYPSMCVHCVGKECAGV